MQHPSEGFVLQLAEERQLVEAIAIDDSASELYAESGLPLALSADDSFARAEQERWREAIGKRRLWFAADAEAPGSRLGFAALDVLDGAPYLDQLAVRRSAMRRGVGRFLLEAAIAAATAFALAQEDHTAGRGEAARWLWLTTYAHLPFNRPFYERAGFEVVPERACGRAVRHHLHEQRRHLPHPQERIAMRLWLGPRP